MKAIEAEQALLGCMIVDPTVIPRVVATVEASDFTATSRKHLFVQISDIWESGKAVDVVTLCSPEWSPSALTNLAQFGLPSNVGSYAIAVAGARLTQRLREQCSSMVGELDHPGDHTESIATLEARIDALKSFDKGRGFSGMGPIMIQSIKELETAMENAKHGKASVPTGLTAIDRGFGGLSRGELWIVAGRPGMGKSSFGLTAVLNAAKAGNNCALVSAEANSEQVGRRLISMESGVPLFKLRSGNMDSADIRDCGEASDRLTRLPLSILDRNHAWDKIKAEVDLLKIRQPSLALVVIDYLGLLSAPVPRGERYLEVGRISSEAKIMANNLDMSVMMLAQLNREVENRPDKKPRLSDLRDSGCIEQDADVVALLFRESYYTTTAPQDVAECNIAKNRDGPTGVIPLRFNAKCVTFTD